MGRWAQARKRGSVKYPFPLLPPAYSDWEWFQVGSVVRATRLFSLVAPATQWQVRYTVNGGAYAYASGSGATLDTASLVTTDIVRGTIRLLDASGSGVSDWSFPAQQVIMA